MKLSLKNLEFGYSRRRPTLNIKSLNVEHFPLAVLGPNGAGKSTLLSLLAGRYKQDSGEIALRCGDAEAQKEARQLRRLTSWVQQDTPVLRGFTAREHVAYSGWLKGMRRRESWQEALKALTSVGLEHSERTPVHKLSGGQRRRLGIASAIVSRPEVLLLDEPYAGLDPEQRCLLRDTLRNLSKSTGLIVSTHQTEDLDEIYATTIVINQGELLFSGSTPEFLEIAPEVLPRSEKAEAAYRRVMQVTGIEAEV